MVLRVFSTALSPRAAGRRRPALRLRSLPERDPAARGLFFRLLIKINDFFVEIIIIFVFTNVFWIEF